MYNTKLLNDFHTLLFYTDTAGSASATQNTKTDSLYEFDCFEDWFDNLITVFVDELSYNVTKEEVLRDLESCPEFIEDMKFEYVELQELCEDDDEADEE
jgi:hypothetical protein